MIERCSLNIKILSKLHWAVKLCWQRAFCIWHCQLGARPLGAGGLFPAAVSCAVSAENLGQGFNIQMTRSSLGWSPQPGRRRRSALATCKDTFWFEYDIYTDWPLNVVTLKVHYKWLDTTLNWLVVVLFVLLFLLDVNQHQDLYVEYMSKISFIFCRFNWWAVNVNTMYYVLTLIKTFPFLLEERRNL